MSTPKRGEIELLLDGMIPGMGNILRKLRVERGWTHEFAAEQMGLSRGQFIKLERGERKLTERTIALAARAFGVDPRDILGGSSDVPIVGIVGADTSGAITYVGTDGELGRAPMPPSGNDQTVAVEVRGASMRGVAEDNWLIYYDDVRSPLTEDMIGELCVLWLADGQVLIKTPFYSRIPGRFDLESTNAPTLREQEVVSAAFVTFLAPRRSVRKAVRKAAT